MSRNDNDFSNFLGKEKKTPTSIDKFIMPNYVNMLIFIKFRCKVMKIRDLKLASLYQEVSLISRIECKYCLISTSDLAGLSDIYILAELRRPEGPPSGAP